MNNIEKYIFTQVAEHNLSEQQAKDMLIELRKNESSNISEDIAIIGMSGKFSSADNLEEYWRNIEHGVMSIRELPKERRHDVDVYAQRFCEEDLEEGGLLKPDGTAEYSYDRLGYLNQIDQFDPAFFNIPPREARAMACEQRLFLESSYEALEDSGYGGDALAGSNTAIFVGFDHNSGVRYKKIAQDDAMSATGAWPGILASRISYIFNFKGPAVVIDTACSSGLVCVHEAVKSLNTGECDVAIAGGVSAISYDPIVGIGSNDLESIESKRKIVSTFDNGVDGTVWGEGVGAVVLKKLSKAIEDGDPIHAVIKGSAINNDGASNGITAPDAAMQVKLLMAAWEDAKIHPETIQYIEAHGTGTVLGDSIEVQAISDAFSKKTQKKQFCAIGSAKSSMGHLVAASGIAGLMKIVLMMKHKKLPKTLNFARPNNFIDFVNSPVYVNDHMKEWIQENQIPRRAGVSSFGFSGTNCHVVLEEYQGKRNQSEEKPFEFFTISGKSENVVRNYIKEYIHYLESKTFDFSDFCYTANVGKGHYEHRIGMIVTDKEDLLQKLKVLRENDLWVKLDNYYYDYHKLVFKSIENLNEHEITEGQRKTWEQEYQQAMLEYKESATMEHARCILEYYVKGIRMDWREYYQKESHVKLHIPYYSFDNVRCWYEEEPEVIEERKKKKSKIRNTIGHPLVHTQLVNSLYQDMYSTMFNPNKLWVLQEHQIFDVPVLPGTSFIEMAVETSKPYFPNGVEIENVIFYQPLVCNDFKSRECHIIVNKKDNELETVFISKSADDIEEQQWVNHCDCTLRGLDKTDVPHVDVEDLIRRLKADTEPSLIRDRSYEDLSKAKEITMGIHWENSTNVAKGHHESLSCHQLVDRCMDDFDSYNLHVSLLDEAINHCINNVGTGFYLPYYYKKMKIYKRMPKQFYSYITLKNEEVEETETVTFDVKMFSMDGEVFAEVEDYSTKRVNKSAKEFRGESVDALKYYQMQWLEEKNCGVKSSEGGATVLLKGNSPLCDEIEQSLQKTDSFITVHLGDEFKKLSETEYKVCATQESFQRLMKDLHSLSIDRIIHAFTCDEIIGEDITSYETLQAENAKGIDTLFYLTKALLQENYNNPIDIVLLTDHAHDVLEDETMIKPHHASMVAMGKVVTDEYPNLICRAIDVDDQTSSQQVMDEIHTKNNAYRVVYRKNQRYTEQLAELEMETEQKELPVVRNGVYVITGGLGGLGLAAAKHIASKEKVTLVLLARTKLPSKGEWFQLLGSNDEKKKRAIQAILEIEEKGSRVVTISADCSNYEQMKQMFGEITKDYGTIHGVIHCAGVAGNGLILTKDKTVFDRVIAPKVYGSWIIKELAKEYPLDFCVFYSSMISIFNEVGQSDYSAANRYMDACAVLLRRSGTSAVAINWPAWKEVGMAVDFGVDEYNNFVDGLQVDEALECLDCLVHAPIAHVLPGILNYSFLKENSERLQYKFSDEIQKKLSKISVMQRKNKTALGETSGSLQEENESIESTVLNSWCKVLGVDKLDIYDRFSNMGGDSLMAIQLHKVLDKKFPGILSISDIFTYPTVAATTEYITEKLGEKEKKATKGKKVQQPSKEETNDEVLDAMLDELATGEASIDSIMDELKK